MAAMTQRKTGGKKKAGSTDVPLKPFWVRKKLWDMTDAEWESLCDGCGRCCLVKLEDFDTGEVAYTDLACRLLDGETCRCTHYDDRQKMVPDCIKVTPHAAETYAWLPRTCAYRMLAEGKPLAWWHPLVSGDPSTVHEAGISVRHRCIPETEVKEADLEDHVIDWID